MGQNKEYRNRPTCIRPIGFRQKNPDKLTKKVKFLK